MKELIELIAKRLVEHKEDVQVRLIENDEGQCYELHVNPEDMGKVIGRGGRTAKAIRTVLGASASKQNTRAMLQIVEQ